LFCGDKFPDRHTETEDGALVSFRRRNGETGGSERLRHSHLTSLAPLQLLLAIGILRDLWRQNLDH